ncbi:MAG TPA: hypothetical protein VFL36_17520 [Myxococcales bacterium]|nr:hypothetical protein [Myxococcales bacterium]
MIRAALAIVAAAALCGVLWVRGCSGPRPELVSARMRGAVLEIVVRNAGFGEGQIQLDSRLHPRGGGAPILRSDKATLRPRETVHIDQRVDGARGDERVEVEIDYPPR